MKKDFFLKTTKIWNDISMGQLKVIDPSEFDDKLIRSIFHVGEYYYYILDFSLAEFLFMSPEIETILGLPQDIGTDDFLAQIHPDDIPFFLKYESTANEFFKNLPVNKVLKYKISFDFRMQKTTGEYRRILHQVVCINHCDQGNPLQALGVHTDITHIKGEGHPTLSFIGLQGEPSFYNYLDPNQLQSSPAFGLTNREIAIIRLISEGLSSKEIAEKLFISYHTVREHRKNIKYKTNLNNSQLMLLAVREGWI